MIRKVFVGDKPYLLDDDGTLLPPIMGGQWGDWRDPDYGAGAAPTIPTGAPPPDRFAPFYGPYGVAPGWPGTGYASAIMSEDPSMPASEAFDIAAQLYKVGPYAPTGSTGSTGSGVNYAARWEEMQAGFQHDMDVLEAKHANDLAILQQELDSAEGMQKEMIQAQIDLENQRHQNNVTELRIQLRNTRKNLIYSEVGATGRTMLQEQGETERQLLELGPDPFKQAARHDPTADGGSAGGDKSPAGPAVRRLWHGQGRHCQGQEADRPRGRGWAGGCDGQQLQSHAADGEGTGGLDNGAAAQGPTWGSAGG
jgi:hypothetical protein